MPAVLLQILLMPVLASVVIFATRKATPRLAGWIAAGTLLYTTGLVALAGVEVFRGAVREAAAAIVLVHNHPSGDPTPSAQDREVTQRLEQAGEIVGIRIVDHVVVAERGYYSFCEQGELRD